MAIVKRSSIANLKDLEGKYCCLESVTMYREVGAPARITKISGARLYYQTFPRILNPDTKDTEFVDSIAEDEQRFTYAGEDGYCKPTKIEYVCDTAKEAIDMANAAKAHAFRVGRMVKAQAAEFHARIAAGEFSAS